MYPKELKAGIRISVPMPTAALFTKSKYTHTHTKPQHKTRDGWINKMWYLHLMGCYSVLKRKEILIHATKSMTFENTGTCKKPG